MSNVENFDILAIHRKTYKQYAIQVKTTYRKSKKWILTKKNEDLVGDNIFYILVSLNELDTPSYHIVPSHILDFFPWLYYLFINYFLFNICNLIFIFH